MTALDEAADNLINTLREISEPVERYKAARAAEARLIQEIKQVKAEVAQELHPDRTWREVGEMLGVTGSRAEQISRGAR